MKKKDYFAPSLHGSLIYVVINRITLLEGVVHAMTLVSLSLLGFSSTNETTFFCWTKLHVVPLGPIFFLL